VIVIIGLGNPLRQDEGIAVRLIEELRPRFATRQDVHLVDIGTSGLRLLDELEGADAAIIVDCALMGEPPGIVVRFTRKEAETQRDSASISPHTGDLLRIVDLATDLGHCPDDLIFFGIEPAALGYDIGLSPALESRVPEYCDLIEAEVARLTP